MNRILVIILFFFIVAQDSFAQQAPQFSQNMFNKLANNPGYAGTREAISTTLLHRTQWMGFEGAPQTLNLSVDAPVRLIKGGLGLNIVQDNIAEHSNLGLQASYSFASKLGQGQLGLGISLGMFQAALGNDWRQADEGDPVINTSSVTGSSADLGAGIYYNTQDVYIGLSTAHISEPKIELSGSGSFNLKRHYFMIAGYYYSLNPNLSLNPSIYLKSDGATSQLDINSNVIYNNKIWGGLSFRHAEPVFKPELVLLTGMHITEDLKFGLAYDIVLSEIGKNSIEFMLGYSFKINKEPNISRHKNPRFL
tara:strand:- start:1053 stop:1976 length:924 start_codon:yes stop_codon:yes gene_type:complete